MFSFLQFLDRRNRLNYIIFVCCKVRLLNFKFLFEMVFPCRFAKDHKLGCKYYHLTLCRHSVKRRVCLVVDCKFTHPKGTKKYYPDLRVNQRSQQSREHIPGQPQVRVTATPIAQARTVLQQAPSVHLSVKRIQNQLQQQKTHPGRIVDANSADNCFLSKLPQILDQMKAQQK